MAVTEVRRCVSPRNPLAPSRLRGSPEKGVPTGPHGTSRHDRRGRTRVWLPRSLPGACSACSLPDETPRVTARARRGIHGRGGRIRTVDLLVPKQKASSRAERPAASPPCSPVQGRPQSKPSSALCSVQARGRSIRFVRLSVVRSTGWVPERILATMSGARKANRIR